MNIPSPSLQVLRHWQHGFMLTCFVAAAAIGWMGWTTQQRHEVRQAESSRRLQQMDAVRLEQEQIRRRLGNLPSEKSRYSALDWQERDRLQTENDALDSRWLALHNQFTANLTSMRSDPWDRWQKAFDALALTASAVGLVGCLTTLSLRSSAERRVGQAAAL